jgi:hypothetical protein
MEWEYKEVTLGTGGFFGGKVEVSQLEALMNNLGRDGWELGSAFAKRSKVGLRSNLIQSTHPQNIKTIINIVNVINYLSSETPKFLPDKGVN